MNQKYNKIGRELNNQVKSLSGKKTNDIYSLYVLRNKIISITPKISNQEIKRALVKSRAHLTQKIRMTKKRLNNESKNNIFHRIRRLATIQKNKTNNTEKNKIINILKKDYNYTDKNIENLLKNIENDTNSAYLTFSIIKKKFNSQKGKRVQNISLEKRQAMYNNLMRQRENLYKLKKYMPENKKKELSLLLKPLTDKISDTKKGIIQKIINKGENELKNFVRNEVKKNNIKRLKPGKYRITENNIVRY